MKEAMLYKKADKGFVDCYLCSFHCHIADGKRGVCGVRENTGGKLYSLVWGRLTAEGWESGCSSIAYTYTEPTIFFEFAYDTALLAREKGLKNLFVTNGYMTPECIAEMKGLLDGANIDLKAFTDGFYKKVCGARLAPVLKSTELVRAAGN